MLRAALLTIVVAVAWPGSASATVPISAPLWAQGAVDRMRVPVPPGQSVILGPCPGYAGDVASGCNFPTPESPIYINPEPLLNDVGAMRVVLYRELGGRFATLAMYPYALQRFERLTGHLRASERAMTAESPAWYAAAELFEDAYADCAMGLRPHRPTLHRTDDRWDDASGYDPTRAQHARVCALIDRVGARAGFYIPSPP